MSSAIDYLRELHHQLQDNIQGPPLELLKHRFGQIEDYESIDPSIVDSLPLVDSLTTEDREKFLYDHVVKPFLSNIPPEDARPLIDIPVGLLPIYKPNAWALQTPEGGNLIALHTELASVISFYTELQIAIMKIYLETQEMPEALYKEGFEAIFQSFRQEKEFAFPVVPVKLTIQEWGFVQMKTFANELFILAHEFAHIALGHMGECVNVRLGMGRKPHVRKLNWEQQQEFDADLKAIEWLHHLKGKNMGQHLGLATESPIRCADVLELIHFVESNMDFSDATSTHPPALERLKHIASGAKELLSDTEMQELSRRIGTTEQVWMRTTEQVRIM